jgi:hypothetical protein
MNFDSFSHGQIKSKLWLCDKIEPYLNNSNIVILGGWYNVLSFLLLSRNNSINKITSIDIDPTTKDIADKITDLWRYENKVENIVADALDIEIQYDTVINCSSEHMTTDWFNKIKDGTLVCIQSSNMTDVNEPWNIVTPSTDLQSFKDKYMLSKTMFLDTLRIQYNNFGYDRYMLVGIK